MMNLKCSGVRGTMFARVMLVSATLLVTLPAQAQEVNIHGLSDGRAVASVGPGKPKVLRPGDTLTEGIKLIRADSLSATFFIHGKKQSFTMGQNIAVSATTSSAAEVTLIADAAGHFFAEGTINGGSIRFLVDTGASKVFLSAQDARRLGIDYLKGQAAYSETAGGTIRVYRVKLDTVRIGEVSVSNVDAVVSEKDPMSFALLGMSFLNRMRMDRDGDQLTLTKRF